MLVIFGKLQLQLFFPLIHRKFAHLADMAVFVWFTAAVFMSRSKLVDTLFKLSTFRKLRS